MLRDLNNLTIFGLNFALLCVIGMFVFGPIVLLVLGTGIAFSVIFSFFVMVATPKSKDIVDDS